MNKSFGILLWFLGGLSVVWTALAILLLALTPADCAVCYLVVRGHVDPTSGAWSTWLMTATAINWIVMTFLDIIFVYLVVTSIYRRHLCMPVFTPTSEVPDGEGQGSRLRNDG